MPRSRKHLSWALVTSLLAAGTLGLVFADDPAAPTSRDRPNSPRHRRTPRSGRRLICGTCGALIAVEPVNPPDPGDASDGLPPPTKPARVLDPSSVALASKLVAAGGTGDATDVALVVSEVAVLPAATLAYAQSIGVHVIACRNSVTDFDATLKGVQPRGWPQGSTWDDVPGVDIGDQPIVAILGHGQPSGPHVPSDGEGQGSYDMVAHELGHAFDDDVQNGGTRFSSRPDFLAARQADAKALTDYEAQPGSPGDQETWAEMFGRFYGGDPTLATDCPDLARLFPLFDRSFARGKTPPQVAPLPTATTASVDSTSATLGLAAAVTSSQHD